ncbi:hypothetical protein EC968_000996 [Mortierella alpina]|nr:hypothetical protein EC968_000996 [Mortierella alpina]
MHTTAIVTIATLWFGGFAAVVPLYVAGAAIDCHGGNANFQFSPGVQFKKQTVQVQGSGDLGACYSAIAPKVTGGEFRLVGSGTGNCPGPFAISWNNGEQSVVPQSNFRVETPTFSVDGGPIEDDKFKGSRLHMSGKSTTSIIEMGAQCVTSGLSSYEGVLDSVAINCE